MTDGHDTTEAEIAHNRGQAYEEAENQGTNTRANPTMGEIIATRMSRRDLARGLLAVSAMTATVSPLAILASDQAKAQAANTTPNFNFAEIAAGSDE
ncbi:MAG: dTDP-glucose 4,6-dehydratase, partial [Bosea sp. (in: a-proteobacteria)]